MKFEIRNSKFKIRNMKYKYEIWHINMKYEIWNIKYEITFFQLFAFLCRRSFDCRSGGLLDGLLFTSLSFDGNILKIKTLWRYCAIVLLCYDVFMLLCYVFSCYCVKTYQVMTYSDIWNYCGVTSWCFCVIKLSSYAVMTLCYEAFK